jgi:hypothetical protein
VIRLALQGPGGVRGIGGVVDSGADRTLLPKSLAGSLGIDEGELEPTEGSEGAGGLQIPTWTSPYVIRARVIVPYAEPRGLEPWGPEFDLTPEFAEETITLFGREDFFAAFTVTIDQPAGDVFHLDYPN